MFASIDLRILLLLLTCLASVEPFCTPNIKQVECKHHKAYCTNFQCNFTLKTEFLMDIHKMGCVLGKTPRSLKVRVRHENRISGNRYGRGLYDVTLELCEFASVNVPLVKMFVTNQAFNSIFQECPYQEGGNVFLTNYSVNVKKVPSMGQIGSYRWSFTVISGRYLEIFSMQTSGERCVY